MQAAASSTVPGPTIGCCSARWAAVGARAGGPCAQRAGCGPRAAGAWVAARWGLWSVPWRWGPGALGWRRRAPAFDCARSTVFAGCRSEARAHTHAAAAAQVGTGAPGPAACAMMAGVRLQAGMPLSMCSVGEGRGGHRQSRRARRRRVPPHAARMPRRAPGLAAAGARRGLLAGAARAGGARGVRSKVRASGRAETPAGWRA